MSVEPCIHTGDGTHTILLARGESEEHTDQSALRRPARFWMHMPRVKLTLAENELLQMRFYVLIEISHIRISATGTCDERHAATDLHLCGTSRGANVEPPVARSAGRRTI